MAVSELLQEKREEILRICAKHGVRNARVFGSAARGEAGPGSDIDFLVEFQPDRSLLDQASLVAELEELLGCKVDVVSEGALLAAPAADSQGGQSPMSKDPRVYLVHILKCIQKIERFTAGGRERFFADEIAQDAVLRNFEVIGEAAFVCEVNR